MQREDLDKYLDQLQLGMAISSFRAAFTMLQTRSDVLNQESTLSRAEEKELSRELVRAIVKNNIAKAEAILIKHKLLDTYVTFNLSERVAAGAKLTLRDVLYLFGTINALQRYSVLKHLSHEDRRYLDEYLFKEKDAGNYDQTYLAYAISTNNLELVKLLINLKVGLSKGNKNGDTPLHLTCFHGNKEIFTLLMDSGVPLEKIGREGNTVLLRALSCCNDEIVILLIEKGANVNAKTSFGDTPLHLATQSQTSKIIELLLQKGADINAIGNEGMTV